jgi:hypothetical protein
MTKQGRTDHRAAFYCVRYGTDTIRDLIFHLEMAVQFVHRDNPDGTRDSICLKCFRTVLVSGTSESERERCEAEHVCGETHFCTPRTDKDLD